MLKITAYFLAGAAIAATVGAIAYQIADAIVPPDPEPVAAADWQSCIVGEAGGPVLAHCALDRFYSARSCEAWASKIPYSSEAACYQGPVVAIFEDGSKSDVYLDPNGRWYKGE